MKTSGYDQLARYYRLIETLAFGRTLEQARFHHLNQLRPRRRILFLGDGDGRALSAACKASPDAHFDSLDYSEGMIARARRRIPPVEHARITWIHANALTANYPADTYDAVVGLFFLDCFSSEQVRAFLARLRPALTTDAIWLHADFSLPPRGWPRLRSRVLLGLMQLFFRFQTGLVARELPASEALLEAAGFRPIFEHSWQQGFIRSVVFSSR